MLIKIIRLLFATFFSTYLYAVDYIKIPLPHDISEKRTLHKEEVVRRALESTVSEFGSFTFKRVKVAMAQGRALKSVVEGNVINLFVCPSNEEWDQNTIAVKTPVRLGLLSYRLLLVNKASSVKFETIKSVEDLSQLTAGLKSDWITAAVFEKNNIPYTIGHNFEGLFLMLNRQRFDYIPRASYEIYEEFEQREEKLTNVVIEPNIALHIPMLTYVYVSPKEPRIAERMKLGLQKLLESGELRQILYKYYSKDILRANIKNRTIIKVNNPYFKADALDERFLWKPE